MSRPQESAAAGRDRLRTARADREQVIEALKDAFVHGCLTRDELGTRTGQALSARTYAELAVVTAAIPATPAPVEPTWPVAPTLRLPLARAVVWAAICLIIAFAIAVISVRLDDNMLHPNPLVGLVPVFLTVAVAAVFAAGLILVVGVTNSVEQRLSRRPARPRRPS